MKGREELDDGRRAEVMPLLSALEDAQTANTGESYRSTMLASAQSPHPPLGESGGLGDDLEARRGAGAVADGPHADPARRSRA